MKLLILGAGMYVTGRESTGNATILSALAQAGRDLPIDGVRVIARSTANAAHVETSLARINNLLGTHLKADYQTTPGEDLERETAALCAADRYDCAIVAIPDHLHAAPIKSLLRAGVPCLVVKPFTATLQEAQELIALQEETGTYGVVEFHKRFDESNLYAKRALQEGLLGSPLYMTVDYSQRISIPTRTFRGWVESTNIFQYLGVHYVDLIYFLTGFTPLRLTAYGMNGTLKARGINTWDSVHVMLEWCNPVQTGQHFLTNFNTNWIDPESTSALSDQRYKIIGTEGRLELDQRNRGIELVRDGQGVTHVNPYFSDYLYNPDGETEFQGYGYKSIARFLRDVAGLSSGELTMDNLASHRPTFRQALVSSAVIESVNHALNSPPAWINIDGIA